MSDNDNAPAEATTTEDQKEEWKDPSQAVAFATLILLDGGIDISEESISKVLDAAKCKVDPRIPQTFQRAVQKKMDLKELIDNFGKGGGPVGGEAAPAAGGATGGAAPAKEETPEPSDKESSKAGPGLFGAEENSDSDSD